MERMFAKDIMIPLDKYPHIPFWFTLRQAIVEIHKSELEVHGRKSLPREVLVFDQEYKLMGTIRRRDILRGLGPDFLSKEPVDYSRKLFDVEIDSNLFELNFDKFIKQIKERAEKPVSEVMQPIRCTVNESDHLMKVIYVMVKNDLSLIPVVQDGRVVGVVRSVGVFHEIATHVLQID